MQKEIRIERFMAFDDIDLKLSEGINVLIGANGTGKTHLMKLLFGAMQQADRRGEKSMNPTLQGLFLSDSIGCLVKRSTGRGKRRFKGMLANSLGFKSRYDKREQYFESINADIIPLALLPPTKGTCHEREICNLLFMQKIIISWACCIP